MDMAWQVMGEGIRKHFHIIKIGYPIHHNTVVLWACAAEALAPNVP